MTKYFAVRMPIQAKPCLCSHSLKEQQGHLSVLVIIILNPRRKEKNFPGAMGYIKDVSGLQCHLQKQDFWTYLC